MIPYKFYMPTQKPLIELTKKYCSIITIDAVNYVQCKVKEFEMKKGIVLYENHFLWIFGEYCPAIKSQKNKPKTFSEKVKAIQGNACADCGWNEGTCHVHHIIPKSQGGKNELSNAIVLCPNCHQKRHNELKRKEVKK